MENLKSCKINVQKSSKLCKNRQAADWFSDERGVRRSDSLAPLLFVVVINYLAHDIKSLNLEIHVNNDEQLSLFMYAGDITLLAETEDDLQEILDTLNNCTLNLWRRDVNHDKPK